MESLTGTGQRSITYDARGLAEPHADVPKVSEIVGQRATFNAAGLTTRQINLELRWLLYEQGVNDVTVQNPGAKHSIGVGILTRCKIRYAGSLGYFGLGLIDGVSFGVHWDRVKRMPGLRPFVMARTPPNSWFVGIDERTAILGDGHQWEVAGRATVMVRHARGTSVYRAGERFSTTAPPSSA